MKLLSQDLYKKSAANITSRSSTKTVTSPRPVPVPPSPIAAPIKTSREAAQDNSINLSTLPNTNISYYSSENLQERLKAYLKLGGLSDVIDES